MKSLNTYLNERLLVNKNFKDNKIVVSTLRELKNIIQKRSTDPNTKKFNKNIDLSDIDVSKLDDLSEIFIWYKFKTIDISVWDTSNVKVMTQMFYGCDELEDIIGIEDIDIKNVVYMAYMFADCPKLDITDKIKHWKINPQNVWAVSMTRNCPTKINYVSS